LNGNQSYALQPFWVGRDIFFHQPAIHRMANSRRQWLVSHTVDHQSDGGAENDSDVDAFLVHIRQSFSCVRHAGTASLDMVGKHGATIGASAPAPASRQASFDHQVGISGTVGHTIGCQMSVFFR
jgi:hypothetical protein